MPLKNKFAENLLDLFFPRRCLNCRKITTNKYFCNDCKNVAAYIKVKTCEKCGLPLKHCSCDWNFYYFDEIISCFESDEKTKNSFYSFKFGGNIVGSKFFSSQMAKRVKKHASYADIDIITSVPLHGSTLNERGYDQVKILAKHISKLSDIKYERLLCQPKKAPKQHETKGMSERFVNVSDKYRVNKNKSLTDKTVLLVDDIKTTGATLSQCARELKFAGAKRVIAISALTVYPKEKEHVEKKKYML